MSWSAAIGGFILAAAVTAFAVLNTWDFYVPARTGTLVLGVAIVFPCLWGFSAFGISAVTKNN